MIMVEETKVKKPRKVSKVVKKKSGILMANRTMDLSMLEDGEGAEFIKNFDAFKAFFIKANPGITYHIDGPDNPLRRYWEYWWAIKNIRIKPSAQDGKRINILEAGCGMAIFQFFLLHLYENVAVLAMDDGSQSPGFEAYCKKAVGLLDIQGGQVFPRLADRYMCRKEDIRRMEIPDDSFNHIFCISVIEHIPEDEMALAELCRVLAPKGTLALTFDFHKDEFPDRNDRLYTPRDIERLIKEAASNNTYLMYNKEFIDMTNWDDPPVRLSKAPDHNYNFGALFFKKY